MAARVSDLVRTAQSTPGPLALTAPAPKPTRRFDDVLATRREQARPGPKAETKKSEHEPRDTAPAKAARRGKAEPNQLDANQSDAAPEAEPIDPGASPADEPARTDPAAKRAKVTTSADEAETDVDAQSADDVAEPSALAEPVTQAALPIEADVPIEAEAEHTDKPAETTASPLDPAALAIQFNMATPVAETTAAAPTRVDTALQAAAATPILSTAKPVAQTGTTSSAMFGEAPDVTDGEKGPTLEAFTEEIGITPDDATAGISLPAEFVASETKPASATAAVDSAAAALQIIAPSEKPAHTAMPAVPQAAPDAAPRTVEEKNVDHIVSSVRGELLTKGGTMQIRLDPPSLGAINVQISVDDGVMTASLQTTNDEATRLLSHNLSQLKMQLESTGVTIDHISVKQAAPAEQSSSSSQQGDSGERQSSREAGQDQSARQEQQRREMLARMWAKLSGQGDPLDLVA